MVARCTLWYVYPFWCYAAPAHGEWANSNWHLTTELYKRYIDVFSPKGFDANAGAKIAKAAEVKYAFLTGKHHDGFCIFEIKLTNCKLGKNFVVRNSVRYLA